MPLISDRMIYLVTTYSKDGNYLVERRLSDLDRKTTIKDIASGEIEDLVQVLECNPVEGICRDVTTDIAREVMDVWANNGEPISNRQKNFIELHVSLSAARAFRMAA